MYSRKAFLGLLVFLISNQSALACRLEGVMGPQQPSSQILREESTFLQTSLVDDPNSLQKESAKRPAKQGAQESYDIEDLVVRMRERGNMDGWGLACYGCGQNNLQLPQVFKNSTPAFADRQYGQAVQQSLSKGSNILMAHIRRASAEYNQVNLSNVHPFTYQSWSFMHNGALTGAFSPVVRDKINQYRDQLGGGPQGTTDSEHAFYFFLANLYEATGTLDSKQIPMETVQKVFAQSINTLIANSERKFMALDGSVLGVQGEIQMQPSCNFILSDGARLLAFKRGFNLFLGKKVLSSGQNLYLLASEKTHTSDKTVQWLALPEDHLLTLHWDAAGNPVPALQPLTPLKP